MFIAHLPAGYLLARAVTRRRPDRRALVVTALLASVLPDLDLFWFYLVDQRQTVHHAYVFHWPLFWLGLGVSGFAGLRLMGWRRAEPYLGMAVLGLLLHMVLDSVAAEIHWLAPFSDWELELVTVPARYGWWVWNFLLHWTFGLELLITAIAALVWWRGRSVVAP